MTLPFPGCVLLTASFYPAFRPFLLHWPSCTFDLGHYSGLPALLPMGWPTHYYSCVPAQPLYLHLHSHSLPYSTTLATPTHSSCTFLCYIRPLHAHCVAHLPLYGCSLLYTQLLTTTAFVLCDIYATLFICPRLPPFLLLTFPTFILLQPPLHYLKLVAFCPTFYY